MSTYQTGSGAGQISLAADITTVGLAASRAITIDLNSQEPGKPVAHSDNATGDIAQQQIGQAGQLRGLRVSIVTKVEFWGSADQRKAQYEALSATYTLDGGSAGAKTYNDPKITVDEGYNVAILSKNIDMI
ncbi:hypothetical protein [Mucilaginibacter sp. AK015]|uniref:hypothetical protein n=1 Tax=Mucilaginibacter sp. AK015 TaxID=2723072 RepID=UPI00160DA95F|nr:hypothetical protein [Mucilaginibacter sp. AK015]MBB5395476.1 hypothetical protein [Mucilaginibacter sp. AK015]